MSDAATVLLGLGANLGRPREQLAAALRALQEWVEIQRVSDVYRTAPVGYQDQPEFLNLVCRGRTRLGPGELLARIHELEGELGRTRTFRNAPRTVDVDLLDHGGQVVESAALELPHPRLHERGFVLVPLVEIWPEWRHPVLGETAAALLGRLQTDGGVRREGPLHF